MTTEATLLVLAEEPATAQLIENVASLAGFAPMRVDTGAELLANVSSWYYDVIVLDLPLAHNGSDSLINRLGSLEFDSTLVLLTGMAPDEVNAVEELARSRGLEFQAVLRKPFIPEDLLRTLLSVKSVSPYR